MTWTVPQTAIVGGVVTASFWNANVRDNFNEFDIQNIQAGEVLVGTGPRQLGHVHGDTLTPDAGLIIQYVGSTTPSGYLDCDGSMASKTTYADLWAVVGTLFGADTLTEFMLPDIYTSDPTVSWIIKT